MTETTDTTVSAERTAEGTDLELRATAAALTDPRALVRLILRTDTPDGELPDWLQARIASLGEDAVPPLLEILSDESLRALDSPGGGWAPAHAARLLAQKRHASAIEPLIGFIDACSEEDEELIWAAEDALTQFGAAALEPVLRAIPSEARLARESLLKVLSLLGVRDERVLQILIKGLPEWPGFYADLLEFYGDPAAIPALRAQLDKFQQRTIGQAEWIDVSQLCAAIENLGGSLTHEERALLQKNMPEGLRRSADGKMAPRLQAVRAPTPGRNDPCPCGSGKKYKKCCGFND